MLSLETLTLFVWAWIGLAVTTCALLFFVKAPYGRHVRKGWGPEIPARLGWILMETPALAVMAVLFFTGTHQDDPAAWAFLIMWEIHYVHRTWIYPFRARMSGKRMPLVIALMAVVFNGVNGGINGLFLFHLAPNYGAGWLLTPMFIGGALIFVIGMAINLHADTVLIRLRSGSTEGYRIPHGGAYRFVSCPNYFGEILEWIGFALATFSLTGVAFAAWTIANLLPRARDHHRWYKGYFPDYPPHRRAVIPGLF